MTDASWPSSLVLVGAGKMGSALLRGWRTRGLPAASIHVVDPGLDVETSAYCIAEHVETAPPRAPAEAMVLAVKPQVFSADPAPFARFAGAGTLVVSILAGVPLARLRAGLPEAAAIVRAMPNLPAAIGRGATGCAAEPALTDGHRRIAQSLLAAGGHVEWLDECLIDAVTAVSGSGPAYVFLLTEALAEAGIEAGLAPDVAARLARATVEGSAALMAERPDMSAAALREAVTSPGGTTAAALEILRGADGLAPLLAKAVVAARRRASDLAGPSTRT